MPLREDLLHPIEGENPSGVNLRYAPVYDKIKEARRQDDDAPQGDWQRERKSADFKLVLKLAGDELAAKSKDLQLAAWLTEALLNQEGFSGLRQGLDLLRGLVENFWDTLYPEAEDGDLELRAAPLEWVGTRLEDTVRKAPITRGGLGYYKYKESRAVGSEEDAAQNEQKRQARETAIAEGKVTIEDFEKDSASTPTAQYEGWVAALDGCLESIESLAPLCETKFGEFAPSFTPLRTAIEEVRHLTNQILQRRLEQEGRRPAPEEPEAEPEAEAAPYERTPDAGTAAAPARRRKPGGGIDPEDLDDAGERLAAVARFLRQQDSSNPAAYLLLRGYRWGELRSCGDSPDPAMLVAPPSQTRQNIRRLSLEANWSEVAEAAESAMSQPCGRAWLDLQRYAVRAAEENGYSHVATAIRSELRALLADLPGLPECTLLDDTPTANAETQVWLKELVASRAGETSAGPAPHMMEDPEPEPVPAGEAVPPDTYALAMNAVRAGRPSEAIELLAEDIPRQMSGRARFHRRLQLAQVCMMSGHEALAQPILEGIAEAIEMHKLEEWEAPDVVAHPLSLLYRCLTKLDGSAEAKHKLYAQISRLDPLQALECGP